MPDRGDFLAVPGFNLLRALGNMTTSEALDELRARITAQYSVLFLRTFEEQRWEAALSDLAAEIQRDIASWTATTGMQPPPADESIDHRDPATFLELVATYPPDHLFVAKDFHPYLKDPQVLRRLKDLCQGLAQENKTLLLLGPEAEVPAELKKDALQIELPLPGYEELRDVLQAVLDGPAIGGSRGLTVSPEDEDRLLKAVLGLASQEVEKALARVLVGKTAVDDEVFTRLIDEKRTLVEGSTMLEFCQLEEGVKDVGGLDDLKDWLSKRALAFSPKAKAQGLPNPKGVLLLGVQGCGKSLTARTAARLLSFPLLRLDIANLLAADRGGSEKNLRDVLRLVTMMAPVVLWMDEVEKGFAGVSESQQDTTIARLIGTFLTWMSEQKSPVFVVATANSIANLPPELLRRGRFDELFFLDLPNFHERRDIFSIHLQKRGWKPRKFDVAQLATKTEGFSGAEIEQVVVSAMIDAYGDGRMLSQEDLDRTRDQIVPLSVTMEEKIFELREWAQGRCRRATSDSRVTKMIEDEEREVHEGFAKAGALALNPVKDEAPKESWAALAEHGQLPSAAVELTRLRDKVTWCDLQQAFGPYMPAEGEYGLALKSDPKIILWTGLSLELADLISQLLGSRRLYLHPVELETYRAAGRGLKLPVLTEIPPERLAKPHWMPVSLRVVPTPGGSSRFGRVAKIRLAK